MTTNCTSCAASISSSAKFCTFCGSRNVSNSLSAPTESFKIPTQAAPTKLSSSPVTTKVTPPKEPSNPSLSPSSFSSSSSSSDVSGGVGSGVSTTTAPLASHPKGPSRSGGYLSRSSTMSALTRKSSFKVGEEKISPSSPTHVVSGSGAFKLFPNQASLKPTGRNLVNRSSEEKSAGPTEVKQVVKVTPPLDRTTSSVAEKSAEKTVEKVNVTEKPVEKPPVVEKPVLEKKEQKPEVEKLKLEPVVEKPAKPVTVVEKPAPKLVEKPVVVELTPVEKPVEVKKPEPVVEEKKPVVEEKPAPKLVEKPVEKPVERPVVVEKPSPVEKPVEKPAEKPVVVEKPAPVVVEKKEKPKPVETLASESVKAEVGGRTKRRSKGILAEPEAVGKTVNAMDVEGLETKPKAKAAGDKFLQMMQQKRAQEFNADRERIRGRREGGVQFMDNQIRQLIVEMKKLDIGGGKGLANVTFGALFAATQETMPALAACINVAKRREILTYDGVMLMQGQHDNVVLTLLKEEVEDTPVFQSFRVAPEKDMDASSSGPQNCHECGKNVYTNERVVANKLVLHKTCFQCVQCKKVLKLASYACVNGKFFCEPHFKENFAKSGGAYNF